MTQVPLSRVADLTTYPVRIDGEFVLYWMTAYRRMGWNFSLDRALEWARELHKPLLVLEAIRCGHEWAADRFHSFVLDGMRHHRDLLENSPIGYYPYVEPIDGEGKGLLKGLADRACLVVTDLFPCFFLPRMVVAAAKQIDVKMEQVDSIGLLPVTKANRTFQTAYSFRRFLQQELVNHLLELPSTLPFQQVGIPPLLPLPDDITLRWPIASEEVLSGNPRFLTRISIDHSVTSVETRGGSLEATSVLNRFIRDRLQSYQELRNNPDSDSTSGLSPYLHWGHISVHEIFTALARHEDWSPDLLAEKAHGRRHGWWGMSENAESFLDELVTWREIGFNLCREGTDYDQYESLPEWSRKTLEDHRRDPRKYVYCLEDLEGGRTHDKLWNAIQGELVTEGRIHNYLRMLWGKKILEWTSSPELALNTMIHLNNKYGLDGRDPNSYTGIFWVMGRYDRPWGPERPIFGKIRYMSSDSTIRKVSVEEYMLRYGGPKF